jgi:hypothetical protein
MTTFYYGLNVGDNADKAVVSTSPTGKEIEVQCDGAIPARLPLELALRNLENFILQQPFPPM